MGMDVSSGTTSITGSVSVSTTSALVKYSASQTYKGANNGKTGASITAGTGTTAYTVTGGKTFYMSWFTCGLGSAGGVILKDGGSGGTTKYGTSTASGNACIQINFPAPIPFTTDVWLDLQVTANCIYSFGGWEE